MDTKLLFSAEANKIDLNELIHHIGEAICLTDNDMVFVAANQRIADFYGKKAEDLIGKSVFEFYPDFKNSVFYEASSHTLKTGEPATRIGYSNNLKKWIVVRTYKYDDNHGIWCAHALNTSYDQHCYVGNYDSLTSLYNRFSFEEDLHKTHHKKVPFGVFICDINKFKEVNDSFDFQLGDMCLMETAARLKQAIPKSKVYRYGHDQFAVIVEDFKEEAIKDIQASLKIFEKPYVLESEEFNLTGSVGFFFIEKFDTNITEIISDTEFALSKAKKVKNSYYEYNESNNRTTDKVRLVKELKNALINNELEIHYQPQIDTITNKVCGAEALVRWRHPQKGLIPPFQFLGVAEEYDLLEEIDRFVLVRAIEDMIEFREKGKNVPISVNFSAKMICSSNTLSLVKNCLKQKQFPPDLLTIEITETSLMEDIEKSKQAIQELSSLGLNIAIDDFGTGYSSMGYLMRYPTNYLKIDREFITNIDQQPALEIMTGNIVKLGHSLSMMVIAEGVETLNELNILKSFNCDIIQGYYFSKPLPKKDFQIYIDNIGISDLKSSIM